MLSTSRVRLRLMLLLCGSLAACGDTQGGTSAPGTGEADDSAGDPSATGAPTDGSADASSGDPTGDASSSGGDGSTLSDGSTASTAGPELVPVTILNGSFELTSFEPGCYSNLTNEEFTQAVDFVTAYGAFNQADFYGDECYGENSDGLFHVGLGADGDLGDAIALELSGPLNQGRGSGYRLRFFASHGETGGATSTNVLIGVSSEPTQFGALVGETGPLGDVPVEYALAITDVGSSFITVQVEPDGDLGWAMLDAFRLEPIE